MCKFTISNLECGHPHEDNVETKGCPYFARTEVVCDRDNAKTRDRVSITTKDRYGICNRCLRVERDRDEVAAIARENEKWQDQSRREAQVAAEELRRAEEEIRLKNLKELKLKDDERRRTDQYEEDRLKRRAEDKKRAEEKLNEEKRREREREAERRLAEEQARVRRDREQLQREKAEWEAQTREAERLSTEEYNRQVREQEKADLEFAMERSRQEEENKRRLREEEETRRALMESARFRADRDYQDDEYFSSGTEDRGGFTAEWVERTRWTATEVPRSEGSIQSPPTPPPMPMPTARASPPPPPPMPRTYSSPPPAPAMRSSPPPAPVARGTPPPPPAPKAKPSAPKPAPKPVVDYSLPAVGPQNIGRFKVGTRAQPIHASQEIPETPSSPVKPAGPSNPAPFVRLGGGIAAADMPIVREAKPIIPTTSGGDGSHKPPVPVRRPSNAPRKSFPQNDESGLDPKLQALLAKQRKWEDEEEEKEKRGHGRVDSLTENVSSRSKSPSEDEARAKRLEKLEFDNKRKMGWKTADE